MSPPFDERRIEILHDAFRGLPPGARAILWLCAAEGQSFASVAQGLGLSPEAAERMCFAGFRMLERSLRRLRFGPHGGIPLRCLLQALPAPEPSAGFAERLVSIAEFPREPHGHGGR